MSLLVSLFQEALAVTHFYIPNWAFAIIAVGFFARLLFVPVQIFVTHQTAKLRQIQPVLDELLKSNKGNLSVYLAESKRVKSEAGVKTGLMMMATLIQLPVFLGMYQAVSTSSLIGGASFLWISSLSNADPFFVLPVLLGVLSYLQFRTAQPSSTVSIPGWVLPLVTTAFCAALPTGILLFSIANSAFQLAFQNTIDRWL